MEEQPTGTVTFLFTDIEGSTRLCEDHPDQMKPPLAEHDNIVKAAFQQHHGYIFAHASDGFGVSFTPSINCNARTASWSRRHRSKPNV